MSSSKTKMTEEELANLSDEEMMSMAMSPEVAEPEEGQKQEEQPEPVKAEEEEEAVSKKETPEEDLTDEEFEKKPISADPDLDDSAVSPGSDDDPDADKAKGEEADDAVDPSEKPKKASGEEDPADPKTPEADEEAVEPDYKKLYEQVMAPFKANGKEIKLQSPEEVVQLMQMGANYTKKLQALQPNLRLLKMLENNDLMDEGKISFLIDLEKRNPKAIQKLLKEGGIDPLDIDTSTEPDYTPGDHKVSDEQMNFTSTLEEVASNPAGKDIILNINKTWDTQSKDALWDDPGILRVLTKQKEDGVYDRISEEVDRRRTLGKIGTNVPFLTAYRDVGNERTQQGAFQKEEPAKEESSRVLETRPGKTRKTSNNDKARAASPTKSSPQPVKQDFNPLSLSDEDFEKHLALAGKV